MAARGADRRGRRHGRAPRARGRGARAGRPARTGRRRVAQRRRLRPPGLAGRRRRPGRAQRARRRDGAGRGRGDPRRRRPGESAPRGCRGGGPAARARIRPCRRRPLRHGVRLHQEPARQRSGCCPVLAGGDDRGRRGPEVHRPAAHHQRVRGRRERGSARSPDRGRGGAGAGLGRPAGGAIRARPRDRLHQHDPQEQRGRHRPTGQPWPTCSEKARSRSPTTCAPPATDG